jgi:hypothetical protein
MKYIRTALNMPWTAIGLIMALVSIPEKISFKKDPDTLVINIKSYWWLTWLEKKRGVRATTHGQCVLLGPTADDKDLAHELVHVEQHMKNPLLHPLSYWYETHIHGYKNNKYEVEAYARSKSRYE